MDWPPGELAWMNIFHRIWETYSDFPLEPGTYSDWAERNPDKVEIYEMIEALKEEQDASSK